MWLYRSGWRKTRRQYKLFMGLLCVDRVFTWVRSTCKLRFFVLHVHKQPSLLLNQITSYLKKIMGNLWQHKTSVKKQTH